MNATPIITLMCMLFVLNGVFAAIPDRRNLNLWLNLPATIYLGAYLVSWL